LQPRIFPLGLFEANYLNDNRVIAGNAAGTQQAVFWWGPFMINLGTPGLNSEIFGLNATGQAAISSEIPTKDPDNENFCSFSTGLECQTALYSRGAWIPLPNINSKGEIAGAAENSTRDPACPTAVTASGTGPQYLDYEAVVGGRSRVLCGNCFR
jgi:hypothetical protein